MKRPTFSVRPADWSNDVASLKSIRERVFVREQNVDPELEWDGLDRDCHHVIAFTAGGEAIATGRLQPDGKIGRMAVLPEYRSQGAGSIVLNALIKLAIDNSYPKVYLYAQTHALKFYQAHGFEPYGEEFDEADIPHLAMQRTI